MTSPVKSLLRIISFVLVVGGIGGLLHEWFGWVRLFGFLHHLVADGYEVYSYIVMIVLGVAVGAAGNAVDRARP
ncbi:hypothetical protein [Streptomyces sp. MST-110588]|uniref:hypothetical protein n=1 Tax=Streptomyces sp. MST-110588 TaxID=2833628 RepID=UPI001F5CA6D2|nr:hypothetical protein [Streptomyces sp. MST-110588]UNO39403.1 hypothetical protein KGS77_07030 [Streptomyces sp. MST-110588]